MGYLPADTSLLPSAINDCGAIVGSYFETTGSGYFHGFLDVNGKIAPVDAPGAYQTQLTGINDRGAIIGFYDTSGGTRTGFVDINGNFKPINPPANVPAGFTMPAVINDKGDVAGQYFENSTYPYYHGFADINGHVTIFDPTGAVYTSVEGINSHGEVVGSWHGSDGVTHGFIEQGGSVISPFDVPGAISTGLSAVNDAGDIAGNYTDKYGSHGFVYTKCHFISVDVPGSSSTYVSSLNDADVVDGIYYDRNGQQHGFVAHIAPGLAHSGTHLDALITGLPVADLLPNADLVYGACIACASGAAASPSGAAVMLHVGADRSDLFAVTHSN